MGPDGTRMANFPWVGWLIGALLSPVGLMLILHLSGQFFSRSLDAVNGGGAKGDGDSGEVPERVQRFYNIMSHAPTVVILLGLLVIGACLFFLDSAMGALGSVGKVLSGYIPWILGCIAAFLVICYIARLYFLSRHRRMMQEYAYRMKVLETTGIIIASKGSEPLKLQDGRVVPIESGKVPPSLPPSGDGTKPDGGAGSDDVVDVDESNIVGSSGEEKNSAGDGEKGADSSSAGASPAGADARQGA